MVEETNNPAPSEPPVGMNGGTTASDPEETEPLASDPPTNSGGGST